MEPTRTLQQYQSGRPLKAIIRDSIRNIAIRGLALASSRHRNRSRDQIHFPFYHHVFDDERKGFEAQLDYMSNRGDFISISDAVTILQSGENLNGNYFCLSFDDGFASCATTASPILASKDIPATFYIVTDMVGRRLDPDDPVARSVFGFKGTRTTLDFATWQDCKMMTEAGMTIGSHTRGHAMLSQLDDKAALAEMEDSRKTIEDKLGIPCLHFCAPYGNPGFHFDIERDPALAQKAGYQSFATGQRGGMTKDGNPFYLTRDQLQAGWGLYQLDYFFGHA